MSVNKDGFSVIKDRKFDKKEYMRVWRENWAVVQNRAYERNGFVTRVSHECYKLQDKCDLKPTIHLSRIDWQKEKRGERTLAGDQKRAISAYNKELITSREQELEREYIHTR